MVPFRPAGVDVTAHMMHMWKVMKPFLAHASTILAYNPFHSLTLASRDCAMLVWQMMMKTAEIWGFAQPCAVKVLQEKLPSKGAYGCRSVEHEVRSRYHSICSFFR